MSNIPLYLYSNSISFLIGFVITGIIFLTIKKRSIEKYKNNYTLTHNQTLYIIAQNFQNESNIRYSIEKKLQKTLQTIHELNNKLSIAEERLKLFSHYCQKHKESQFELENQININHKKELKIKELIIRLEEHKLITQEKQKLLIENEKKLTMQFENLANRIFTQHEYTINKKQQNTLNNILHPFREQLKHFQNQIQTSFSQEEKIKHSLTYEIRNLHQLNSRITQETINLTQALKGNNKIQGNWGEVILTRVLEASGMRAGHEFHIQKHIIQENGCKLQPDVIVHLPQNKKIIIDSKVSLIAYERYFNSKNEKNQKLAIIDHISSLRTHITSLSKKNYQKIFEINTLDYILMFIPIESAFIVAIEKESSLLTDAIRHNIMLVSPTTLLIALRTINNLWRHENQNYHAKKILDKAGRLYDKIRLFIEDFNKIGQYLNKADTIYNTAKNKFYEGKGNIINQIESFQDFGVQIKQPITSAKTITKLQNTSLIHDKKNTIYPNDLKDNNI